jgi:hypothetical protein
MFDYTGFLYARPTFVSGISRVVDLGNTLNDYNSTFFTKVADFYALKSDWSAVGADIQYAITEYGEKEKQT